MTQAKKLKKQIRARARRTGESYTAARRQVLRQKRRSSPLRSAPALVPAPAAPVPAPPRGSAEQRKQDARLVLKTGHGLDHWFAVLDAFDSPSKGHTASARHLAEDHGVGGWHAQEITVAYERARGLRAANQRLSGEYEVSISKVLPAPVPEVVDAILASRRRSAWAKELDPQLRASLEAALAGPKGLRQRPQGDARLRFRTTAGHVVELYVNPKSPGRSLIVARNAKLKAKAEVERYRTAWRPVLESLSRHLA